MMSSYTILLILTIGCTNINEADSMYSDCSSGSSSGVSFVSQSSQIVAEGEHVFIVCNSETIPVWTREGIPLPQFNKTFVLYTAKKSDAGNYTCEGVFQGLSTKCVSTISVAQRQNDKLTPEVATVTLGQGVTFYCNSSSPVTWKHRGFPLSQIPRNRRNIQLGSLSVAVARVQLRDSGIYRCYGQTSGDYEDFFYAEGTLIVNDPSKVSPFRQNVYPGKYVCIYCESSIPPLWYFGHNPVLSDIGVTMAQCHNTNNLHVLEIKNVSYGDQGVYRCDGRNMAGDMYTGTSEIMVIKRLPYRITPSVKNARKGDKVKFYCFSHGPVKWTFNGRRTLPPEVSLKNYSNKMGKYRLQIKHAKSYHQGIYMCEGKEVHGGSIFHASAILYVGANDKKKKRFWLSYSFNVCPSHLHYVIPIIVHILHF